MAIDPNALAAFLRHRTGPPLDYVKGLAPDVLEGMVKHRTGMRPHLLTPPRAPQLEGLAAAIEVERFLAFYQMRMGKSKLALDWAMQLAISGRWNKGKGIILFPAPILSDVWAAQTARHSVLTTVVVDTKIESMIAALNSDADLILASWSSLQIMLTQKRQNRKGKPKLYPDNDLIDAIANEIDLVIIDEIHGCKNWQSLRFQIGEGLVDKARFRMGLTGTPWGRNPLDAWAQAFLIDGGKALGRSYHFFEAAFGVKQINYAAGQRKEFVFDKAKMPILQAKLATMSLSYRAVDDGVGVYAGAVELRARGDQLEAYQTTIQNYIKLPSGEKRTIEAVFVRLRQIASGFLPFVDDGGVTRIMRFASNPKMEWLREFLENVEDLRIVIFHEFTITGDLICRELETAKVKHVWLHGATKDKPAVMADFQTGKAQAIVVQSASGGMGLDLSMADYQCFVESPTSPTVRAQAEYRAQGSARGGRPLYIDDLVAAPVDVRVLGLVQEGKDCLAELFRDPKKMLKGMLI